MTVPYRLPRFFLTIFIIVSIIDILAILTADMQWQTFSKPLIIPSLMAYYIASSKSPNKLYLFALLFSFAGDVLLLDKMNLFLYGIAAFLVTQIIYVYLFSKGLKNSSPKQKTLAFAPFLIFFITLIGILRTGLQDFFIPVVVYGMAISVFGAVSLLKFLVNKDATSKRLLIGAVLFIISDSMIALHKFEAPRSFYPVAIMITYVLAQYFIAVFILRSEASNFVERDA